MRPLINDCTLREGAQAPGVHFSADQAAEVAQLLVACGVDMIECGHPAVSSSERDRISRVAAQAEGVPVLVHARALRSDIDAAKGTGASWVGIFLGVNEISRRTKLRGRPLEEVIGLAQRAVEHAVMAGLSVRFTVEDASRTDASLLTHAYSAALEAGARRIGYADTVGLMEPDGSREIIARLRRTFADVEIECHFHNDRGLALSNALASIDAGADWISTAINGLGERCGITDQAQLLANLHYRNQRNLGNPLALQASSRLVAAIARTPIGRQAPVVGSASFTHTAALHKAALAQDEQSYSWLEPKELGRQASTSEPRVWSADDLILRPVNRSATELRHHRHGPGDRYLYIDDRLLDGCAQYCIVRHIERGTIIDDDGHVDSHRHDCDSLFAFVGDGPALSGLTVEVVLDHQRRIVESPSSVFVPASLIHSYRVISGSGFFINHVLSGEYNVSLLD